MSAMQVVLSCPLGHKCEEARDGAIHRCVWFTKMQGQHPTSGEVVDEQGCAMAWLPVLLAENARVVRGSTATLESLRNTVQLGNTVLAAQTLSLQKGNGCGTF